MIARGPCPHRLHCADEDRHEHAFTPSLCPECQAVREREPSEAAKAIEARALRIAALKQAKKER